MTLSPPMSDAVPRYRGPTRYLKALPSHAAQWPETHQHLRAGDKVSRAARKLGSKDWPRRDVIFISDAHADAEAFIASLVASGGVRLTSRDNLVLTARGKRSVFVIGGDCLDKGPSNLELLEALRTLMRSGARLKLLAGNHDMRLMLALMRLSHDDSARTDHLFVRMGAKGLALLKEVFDHYLADRPWAMKSIPSRSECRRRLYPGPDWAEQFRKSAGHVLKGEALEKEITRLSAKADGFEHACEKHGLSLRQTYAAALKAHELFLKPGGRFAWFFDEMRLAYRSGAFLHVHAGVDDAFARRLGRQKVSQVNQEFRRILREDPFTFYYGELANVLRTKYRKSDMVLSAAGVKRLHKVGIRAVMHGHVNHQAGQQLGWRHGLLHIEGDVTLDRNSRRKEGLDGVGMGATLIEACGRIVGISNDHPEVKVYAP